MGRLVKQLRKTNTVAEIKNAFVDLIYDKGFRSMNVIDITRAAGIGRGTFYTHYTDKYDLLEKIENELLDQLQSDLKNVMPNAMQWLIVDKNAETPAPFILETLNNFYQNRRLIAALLSEKGDPHFISKVKKVIFADLDSSLTKLDKQITVANQIPEDYAREFTIDEVMGVIVYWISKDRPEAPAKVAQIITKLQNEAPMQLFAMKKNGERKAENE